MRSARIVCPGFPHHIIVRGNNRRRLFSYPHEYRAFVRFVVLATEEHPVLLHNFAALSNHAHFLATPEREDSLAKWTKSFLQRYAQARNERRDGSGKLFEQRYRSHVITNEAYLARVTAYVELNPIRAGLKRRLIDYPWSTYRLHIGQPERSEIPARIWTPNPWYLELGNTAESQAAAFREWLETYDGDGLEKGHLEDFEEADEASEPYTRRLERPNRRRAV